MNASLDWRDALRTVMAQCGTTLPAEEAPLAEALGRVAAAEVRAPFPVPPFDNSALDGFAIRHEDAAGATPELPVALPVAGSSLAGQPYLATVPTGSAIEIMTGAQVPEGADAIVPVEATSRAADGAVLVRMTPRPGHGVRRAGGDVRPGDLIMASGDPLDPPRLGLLASVGCATVPVRRRPVVALLTSGDELIEPGVAPLGPGQIYDSNGTLLAAQWTRFGATVLSLGRAPDAEAPLRELLQSALGADLLVTVGGVSMGRTDLLRPVLHDLGATEHFWKVNQQPGGPLAFLTLGTLPILALPGNPVSAWFCGDLYGRALLAALAGAKTPPHLVVTLPLADALHRATTKATFHRGRIEFNEAAARAIVRLTGLQDSNRIHSLIGADGYVLCEGEPREVAAGTLLPVVLNHDASLAARLAGPIQTLESLL